MMKNSRSFQRFRRGSVMVMTTFAGVFLLGLTAMVVDVGLMYLEQARLQTAVNAGWKAGFDLMKGLKAQNPGALSTSEKYQITSRVMEVIQENGYSATELQNVQVNFDGFNQLEVTSSQTVGLFFAQVMDFRSATVQAGRDDGDGTAGMGIIPLAIPHGVVKDLSKTTFDVSFFLGDQGFVASQEYILKLGSGNPGDPSGPVVDPTMQMILVPMDSGSQSDTGFLRAYGVAFWCLKIDGADAGFTPVYWLLGYRGGSFLLQYHDDVLSTLGSYGVNYQVITGSDNIQAILDQVNPNVLELFNRPRVAIYSSQDGVDHVEQVLIDGRIPYGTYGMPPSVHANGWTRNEAYNKNRCGHVYDQEILSGFLDSYHWIHLHHEDFTGFSGGCDFYDDTCYYFWDKGYLGTKSGSSATRNRMCSYCRGRFTSSNGSWASYNAASCINRYRRCAEKQTYNGLWWRDLTSNIYICKKNDSYYPQCFEYNQLRPVALANGFTDDPGSTPKPQTPVSTNGATRISLTQAGWFDTANAVQKMKWQVARLIRNHVEQGGFLFAQCFAPETLDLALFQAGIHDGLTVNKAYDECLAFEKFEYRRFPFRSSDSWYSTINSQNGDSNHNLMIPLDPRCQNHGTGYCCDSGTGHTDAFAKSTIKNSVTLLGRQSNSANYIKYLSGKRGNGDFTFLGGHYTRNVEVKRTILNNILLGALVTKVVSGGTTVSDAGKQKSNYGPIDPDNTNGGGANDYRDRFIYGFDQPLQLGDRIMPEPGNMRGPTDQAVDAKVNGIDPLPPNRFVILPITDIPPEVPVNNSHNASATSIYDLQGNDHPNGAYDPASYNFGSSVRIIGFAMFEIIEPSEYQRSGSSIQAGDNGDLGMYQPGQVRGRFVKYIVKPGEIPVS